jgi:hypothetical protein
MGLVVEGLRMTAVIAAANAMRPMILREDRKHPIDEDMIVSWRVQAEESEMDEKMLSLMTWKPLVVESVNRDEEILMTTLIRPVEEVSSEASESVRPSASRIRNHERISIVPRVEMVW